MSGQKNLTIQRTGLSLLLFLCLSSFAYSQQTRDSLNGDMTISAIEEDPMEIYRKVDQVAVFGKDALATQRFFGSNLFYPQEAKAQKMEGMVLVQFVINADGKIDQNDIKILRSPGQPLSEEVIRLIRKMPKWQPALRNGKPVRSYFTLPITFKMT